MALLLYVVRAVHGAWRSHAPVESRNYVVMTRRPLRVESECPRRNRGGQVTNQRRSTDSRAAGLSQPVHELCAPFDVELAECLAKVVVDGVRADKELSGDLSVGATFRCEASDLRLLRSELASRVRGASPGMLTRRLQLAMCALGERLHAEVVEHLESDP